MLDLGRDFGEWSKYESSLQHSWMGNLQLRSVYRQVSVEKDIDVEKARSFRKSFLTAERGFKLAKIAEELERRGLGLSPDDTVEKPWLVEMIYGLGFIE